MMPSMMDPAIGALLAGLFALLFTVAAVHKLRGPAHFAQVFAAYRLLPQGLGGVALVVPVLEALVAIGLLLPATRALAAGAGACLLGVYALAIAVNLRRGRRELSCGCGGPHERRPIAAWMVARNLLLAAVLPVLMLAWAPRPLAAVDVLTVAGGIAIGALVYASLDRLLARVAPRGARLQGLA
jgi:uncharacterized membrane protein